MSLVHGKVSPKRLAANRSNAQRSTGPKTPEGKARVALNALKTGAYAKGVGALRQILLKSGEDPQEREKVERDLMESWQPDDTMQAIMVQGIADKTWDLLQLRGLRRQSQLTALLIGQIQTERQQLLSRRWLPGCPAVEKSAQGLWLAKDSGSKFKTIFDILDDLQKWFENNVCPDEYPQAMRDLYGECPSLAGEKTRLLFIEFFNTDDETAAEKAALELPKWIAQERRDVQQEQELYRRERELQAKAPSLTEEQAAAKEAMLERQIGEQTRLLLQLKSKHPLWPAQFEAAEAGVGPREGTVAQSASGASGKSPKEKDSKDEETVAGGPTEAEYVQKGQTKPPGHAESTT